MGCTGDRERGEVEEQQKWDYITIADFYATSSWTYLSYGWLWFLAIVAVAVYAADTFTAVNLLVYNKWSSQIQPAIPFQYSKWIFAACIIISWVLCGWEWQRAVRVIRRGGVAESYMDPLAPETERDAYFNPSIKSQTPLLWIPRDPMGISAQEVRDTRKVIPITDEGATFDNKGNIVWDAENGRPPIWEKPVYY
ncbi:hypothetical protein LTR28_013316 [Elasticomyces elasticus]|nr:hypothetical protein LTR28_013316 [Elasticomyces elasticus]